VFLDVRDKIEYTAGSSSPYGKDFAPRKGRLPGAKNIEWYNFMKQKEDGEVEFKSPEEIEKLMNSVGIKKDTETCLYCFKGARASNSYFALQQAGFTKVRMYFQGWNEWSRDDSLPIDST
jgi:thiosulfate/3-mercaptopyruvate sulfurtransferase